MLRDAQHKGIHGTPVAVVQGLERAGVALKYSLHQLGVWRLFAPWPGLNDREQQNCIPFPFSFYIRRNGHTG